MATVKHDEFVHRGITCYCWKVLPKNKGELGYYWTVDIKNLPVYRTPEYTKPAYGFDDATRWIDRVVGYVVKLVEAKVLEV